MKLWYKKKKITLQDISLTKQEGPKGAHEEFLAVKLIAIPTHTSNEESEVEFEEWPTKAHEEIVDIMVAAGGINLYV
jgi:hypothetical protein